jgi:hypothetical protein
MARRVAPHDTCYPIHSDHTKKDRESAASACDAGPPSDRGDASVKAMSSRIKYAGIMSVSDKTGLAELGRRCGAAASSSSPPAAPPGAVDAGLPVIAVAEVTAFPEMMDGRVKTLHPAVHGGILARRHRPDDMARIARHGIARSISWS